jgi:N-acetylglucosamine-6-sulfatase
MSLRSGSAKMLGVLLLGVVAAEEAVPSEPAPPPLRKWTPGTQKNVIMLLTDDQDLRLGSMAALSFTTDNIHKAGANMSNFFIHTPICCPCRTSIMSGKFVHNNKVKDAKSGGCMRMNTSRAAPPAGNPKFWEDSFIHRLRYKHGYATGVFGKLLNGMTTYGCNGDFDVPGLDRGYIMCNAAFFHETWADYTTDDSGKGTGSVHQTGNEPANYTTSLLGNASLAWIRSIVGQGKDHPPFFAFMGPHAPHLPSTPAPWYVLPEVLQACIC